jgi:hypothetical protein
MEPFIESAFRNIIEDCSINPLLITMMEAEDENLMRNYLSSPRQRFNLAEGKVWALTRFEDIWHFFRDKIFICIHLKFDPKTLISKPSLKKFGKNDIVEALIESNIQIGILCRKSTSGKKAFFSSFFEDFSDDDDENEEEAKTNVKSKLKDKKNDIPEKPIKKKIPDKKLKKEVFKKIKDSFKEDVIDNIVDKDVDFRITRNYLRRTGKNLKEEPQIKESKTILSKSVI